MTKQEQYDFIKNLTLSIQTELIEKLNKNIIPEDWNGIELRQLLADKFVRECYPMSKTQKKNYNNTIATTTL